uniref:RrF2 family transcriptional regulator n=1 Tax=Pararhizobium sp. IMCC3301 TaxID=3067904 RepID=UPI002741C7B3|nr:Rrf2 family transcriptional regulator [Pararhizobium sp. IMCC3301]
MRLNQASDFALRILMLLATQDQPVTIDQVAGHLHLVKSHIMKITAKLAQAGFVETQRGRNGGILLGRPSDQIRIGDVVRLVEADFAIVECMRAEKSACTFLPRCLLRGVVQDAADAFLAVLDNCTLDQLVASKP